MTRKLLFSTAIIMAGTITTTLSAQQCGGPVPILSVYTTLDRATDFGIGGEAGSLSDESPWGYFGGFMLSIKTLEALKQEKENTTSGESIYRQDLSLYIKGSYRFFQSDQSSFHAVSTVELNRMSRLDIKAGFRLLLPVSDKVALSAEPLYSYRNRNVTGRVGLAIGL